MKKSTLLLLSLLTLASAQVKNLAVVETELDAQSGASAKLSKADVRQITATLRREAVNNLPRGKYNIMTSETVIAQGSAKLEECADENCVITLGSKIGADFIVRGIIGRIGTKLTVSVETYETENGNLVASSDLVRAENIGDLIDKTAAACAKMYKAFANTQISEGPGTLADSRDGKTYRTVVIGGRRWMAENLNYTPKTGNSWCYDDDKSNCDKYGRLYDWGTAKTACPAGWHLPSRDEWGDLAKAAGGVGAYGESGTAGTAGKKLKAKSGWEWEDYDAYKGKSGNGTDDYGFSALPGGLRSTDGDFSSADYVGNWWTATEFSSDSAYSRNIYYRFVNVFEFKVRRREGLSVRCVQN